MKLPPIWITCPYEGGATLVAHCHEFHRIRPTLNIKDWGLFGLIGLRLVVVPRCSGCGQIVTINEDLNDVIHGGSAETWEDRVQAWASQQHGASG